MKIFYIRAINPLNWISVSKEENLFGDAICSDWDCSNSNASNQWSLFEIATDKPFSKGKSLDLVAIYLLFSNFSKFSEGISFLFVEPSFFNNFEKQTDEDLLKRLSIKHININGVLYKNIKDAVSYTNKTIMKNIVSYDKKELSVLIKKYFGSQTDTKIAFEKHYSHFFPNKGKINKMYNKINSSFFPDGNTTIS